MSLYWSLLNEAIMFWSAEGVKSMVDDMKIQVVRASMATTTDDWQGCKNGEEKCGDNPNDHYRGYAADAETQTALMNKVIQAAIDNDIYVIIDWHSHQAEQELDNAKKFFEEMAQKWGKYDNIIFEVYNEPKEVSWDVVKNYANQVAAVIRKHSDNLILVGNPNWDQNPQNAIGNEVTGGNIAYTMHYYAGSHCYQGNYDWGGECEGTKTKKAIEAGLSIFVSEWGTGNADGGGNVSGNNAGWQDFINQYKLSWANWSASKINEGTAAFTSGATPSSLQYSASGNTVKGYLSTNPATYTACPTKSNPGNPEPNSSASVNPNSSASGGDAIPMAKKNVSFGLKAIPQGVQFTLAGAGMVKIEVFDVLGHSQMMVSKYFASGTHQISMEALPAGSYIVKVVKDGLFDQKLVQNK